MRLRGSPFLGLWMGGWASLRRSARFARFLRAGRFYWGVPGNLSGSKGGGLSLVPFPISVFYNSSRGSCVAPPVLAILHARCPALTRWANFWRAYGAEG